MLDNSYIYLKYSFQVCQCLIWHKNSTFEFFKHFSHYIVLPRYFLAILVHISIMYLSGNRGPCQKNFYNLKYLDWLKMSYQLGLRSFYKPFFKIFELNIWAPIPI